METFIVHPGSKEKATALKAVMKALKIPFEETEEIPSQSIADDIRESIEEVKLHESGKIKLPDARVLFNEI